MTVASCECTILFLQSDETLAPLTLIQVLALLRGSRPEITRNTKKRESWIWPLLLYCFLYSQHKSARLWGHCDTNELPPHPALPPILLSGGNHGNSEPNFLNTHPPLQFPCFSQHTHVHKPSYTHRHTSKYRHVSCICGVVILAVTDMGNMHRPLHRMLLQPA